MNILAYHPMSGALLIFPSVGHYAVLYRDPSEVSIKPAFSRLAA